MPPFSRLLSPHPIFLRPIFFRPAPLRPAPLRPASLRPAPLRPASWRPALLRPASLRHLFSHPAFWPPAGPRARAAPAPARALAPALALALAFALLPAFPLHAQQADPPQKPPPPKSRAFKTPAAENPFAMQVVPWFSLAPPGATLIRPGPQGSLDLAAREDQTYITVFGKKKLVDPRTDREHDYSAATWSDVGLPKDIPIGPPGNCSSGAYRTIGGQAATGADLMGGLGGGRC